VPAGGGEARAETAAAEEPVDAIATQEIAGVEFVEPV
jgi:hypothetical protein